MRIRAQRLYTVYRVRLLSLSLALLAAGVLTASLPLRLGPDWLFAALLALLLSQLRVGLPFFGEASLHFLGGLMAAYLFSPAEAGLAAALGYWGRFAGVWRELFNRSQLFLAAALAAAANDLEPSLVGGLAGAVAYLAVNAGSVALVYALLEGRAPGRRFWRSLVPYALTYLFLSPSAYLASLVYRKPLLGGCEGWEVLLLGLPVLYAYSSWRAWRGMQEAVDRALEAVVRGLEAKDPYTAYHSERVAAIAEALARELGLPPDEVALVRRAGILHDIGKLGVQDAILQKPGELTEEERLRAKGHVQAGHRILHPLFRFLPLMEEAVLYHHERWDGLGYPRGLKGEEIPLVARILAVADAYEAMTSDRPYCAGMLPEEALEEIRREAGRQFDPEVVAAFEQAFARDEAWKTRSRFVLSTQEVV